MKWIFTSRDDRGHCETTVFITLNLPTKLIVPTYSISFSIQPQLSKELSNLFAYVSKIACGFLSHVIVPGVGNSVEHVDFVTFKWSTKRPAYHRYRHIRALFWSWRYPDAGLVCFGCKGDEWTRQARHRWLLDSVKVIVVWWVCFFWTEAAKGNIRTNVPLALSFGIGRLWLVKRTKCTVKLVYGRIEANLFSTIRSWNVSR